MRTNPVWRVLMWIPSRVLLLAGISFNIILMIGTTVGLIAGKIAIILDPKGLHDFKQRLDVEFKLSKEKTKQINRQLAYVRIDDGKPIKTIRQSMDNELYEVKYSLPGTDGSTAYYRLVRARTPKEAQKFFLGHYKQEPKLVIKEIVPATVVELRNSI